jgi:hypothetical protein
MKKFTILMLAVTITTLVSAQVMHLDASKIETPIVPQELSDNAKSAWIGGGFDFYYTAAVTGDEFFIVGSEFAESVVGDEITKVKFYHELGDVEFAAPTGVVTFDNTEYTIRIYENPTLAGDMAASGFFDIPIGTPVYTETVTLSAAESGTVYEHTLTTPYTINSNEYWISVSFDDGKGAMRLAGPAATNEDVYYMYYNYGGTNYVLNTNFGSAAEPEFYAVGVSLFVDDGGAYEEQSDLATKFLDVYPDPTAYISELTISETEDMVLYPVIVNNGPDATSENVTYSATINGDELIAGTELDLTTEPLDNGYFTKIIEPDGSYTMTADELDALSLPVSFDVCFTSTYAGTDPTEANNTACITVTRGEIPETTCDLEAVFMTSNEDPTPIAPTMSITPTDDITMFPGVINNGPDEANTSATVTFSVDGNELLNQSTDMTGLPSGAFLPLTQSGRPITAADMNTLGLSGTFDICMTVTYDGIDNEVANNESCITITRGQVGINNNVSETMVLYPNPANNVLFVENAQNANISVYNMVGQVMLAKTANSNRVSMDLSKLSEGAYIVRIANGDEVTTQKLNIVR